MGSISALPCRRGRPGAREVAELQQENQNISLMNLVRAALYIGVTGYGGPALMGQMKQVFVNKKKWMPEDDFLTGLSLGQLLPGAASVNVMTFIGYYLGGAWGALLAAVCMILPATVLMIILSAVYFAFGQLPAVKALFVGLGAVVVALLINAIVTLGRSALRDAWAAVLALLAFSASVFLKAPILLVVVCSAVLGLALYYRPGRGVAEAAGVDALPAAPAKPMNWPLAAIVGVGAVALLLLTARALPTRLFMSMAHVGTLAFGGGFSSVPFLQSEAVDQNHWLTVRQFLDGIALGQITPGPVLITSVFIGFHLMGVVGALIGAAGVFLPSGLAMFFMARESEAVKNVLWLRAMIRGVVASFIGVLLSVALRLGRQSLIDWKTIAIAAAGTFVLLVLKKDPLWVILGGAALSLVLFL